MLNDSKEQIGFKNLISTIPLPLLVKLIKNAPLKVKKAASELKYVSVCALNLGFIGKESRKDHWIYFANKSISFYRVGFYSNVNKSSAPSGCSSLYAEVSYDTLRKIDINVVCGIEKKTLKKQE